jgi:hypothetical protein
MNRIFLRARYSFEKINVHCGFIEQFFVQIRTVFNHSRKVFFWRIIDLIRFYFYFAQGMRAIN